MLAKIREKTQGTFAWAILILICVPFALWGLQNYTDNPQENTLIVVGDKEFIQRDLTQAYTQFKQQYAEMKIPEEMLQKQAMEKLIRDELLLQHVTEEKLSISDKTARQFIAALEYFQVKGKFDKAKYESLLGSQGMTSTQFVNRIRKALIMEQFQKAITETSFVTDQDIASFFKIQNQTRDIEYVTLKHQAVTEKPIADVIHSYYQQHKNDYQTTEQVSIEYVELTLSSLMEDISPSNEQIENYYNENKDLYSKKERRKIAHILFAADVNTTEDQALQKATTAHLRLEKESFISLAAELSDDTLTAKTGGDLGLFEIGVMEPAFEKAATNLKLGDVSMPVKSAFGYHLITVTELVPAETKTLDKVKDKVILAVKRLEAESSFYELSETLTEVSFENADNLTFVSEQLGLVIKKTGLFSRDKGIDIAVEDKIRHIAFSEDVLQGKNSEPVEVNDEHLVVLRILEHHLAETKALSIVEANIITQIQKQQADEILKKQAETMKLALMSGSRLKDVTTLAVKRVDKLARSSIELPWALNQAVFKAAKPIEGKTSPIIVTTIPKELTVVNILAVNEETSEGDAEKTALAEKNIARALGQSDYEAVIDSLRAATKVMIKQ